MDFNLIHHFRKYQRFWMACILFVCMVTFVLCTGLGQGGLQDRILEWFRRLANPGKMVVQVNGRAIYGDEMDRVKKNREMANDFMREALKITAAKVEELYKIKDKQLQKGGVTGSELEELEYHHKLLNDVHKMMLAQIAAKPRFFETGTKFEEMLDFLTWREHANQMNVDLVEKDVKDQLEVELTNWIWIMNSQLKQKNITQLHHALFWNSDTARVAMYKLRTDHPNAEYDTVLSALKDEFRVQIVQYAVLGARTGSDPTETDSKNLGYTIRFPVTPHQLWTAYQTDMTPFDVALLPIKAEEFLNRKGKDGKPLIGEPTQGQLEALFKEYSKTPYNPASDKPGFVQPEKVKVQYVSADPESPHYRNLAKLTIALQTTPPGFIDLGAGALGTAVRQAVGKPALDASLEEKYQELLKKFPPGQTPFPHTPLTEPGFEMSLYTAREPSPEAAAGLVGALALPGNQFVAGLSAYQAEAYVKHKDELEGAVRDEIERRVSVAMALLLSAASPYKHDLLGMTMNHVGLSQQHPPMPFAAIEPRFIAQKEKKLAGDLAARAMESIQKYLAEGQKKVLNEEGKAAEFEVRLKVLKDKFGKGLEVSQSKDWDTQYTVDKDAGLDKLKQAFAKIYDDINRIETRSGGPTDNKLSEDDFYKMFFDPAETFSVAAASPYSFQKWPPTVTAKTTTKVNVGDGEEQLEKGLPFSMWTFSDHRFLFWKTASKEPVHPEKLAEVEDKVRQAWKLLEARKLAFEAAKEIAVNLQKKEQTDQADYIDPLKKAATEYHTELITLDRVSKKEKVQVAMYNQLAYKYEPRKLPKTLIPYPREDMSNEVFGLLNLKEPLQYWKEGAKEGEQPPGYDEAVHKLNQKKEGLFQDNEERQIQVMTNKPRNIYYVAAVNKVYPLEKKDFATNVYAKTKAVGLEADFFNQQARAEKALQYRTAVLDQLKRKYLKNISAENYQQ